MDVEKNRTIFFVRARARRHTLYHREWLRSQKKSAMTLRVDLDPVELHLAGEELEGPAFVIVSLLNTPGIVYQDCIKLSPGKTHVSIHEEWPVALSELREESILQIMAFAEHQTSFSDKPRGQANLGAAQVGVLSLLRAIIVGRSGSVRVASHLGTEGETEIAKFHVTLQLSHSEGAPPSSETPTTDVALLMLDAPSAAAGTGMRVAGRDGRFHGDERPARLSLAETIAVAQRRTRTVYEAMSASYASYWARVGKPSRPFLRGAFVTCVGVGCFVGPPILFAMSRLMVPPKEERLVLLMRAAAALAGFSLDDESRFVDIVCLMCTMVCCTMPYVPDVAITSKGKSVETDQWQNAWLCFGGDCDDSGLAIKSLLDDMWARAEAVHDAKLKKILRHVKARYRPGICICTVEGAKFGQHNPRVVDEERRGDLRGHVVAVLVHRSHVTPGGPAFDAHRGDVHVAVLEGTDAVFCRWGLEACPPRHRRGGVVPSTRVERHVQRYVHPLDTYYRWMMTIITRPERADGCDLDYVVLKTPDETFGVLMEDMVRGEFLLVPRVASYSAQDMARVRLVADLVSVPNDVFPYTGDSDELCAAEIDELQARRRGRDDAHIVVSAEPFADAVYLPPVQLYVNIVE